MSVRDRLTEALFEFLQIHGDFRLTEYDKDEPQQVYWDGYEEGFQPLVGQDTTYTIQYLNPRKPEGFPTYVYFTFQLHALNKWAVVEDKFFDGLDRGFTCRIRAYAEDENTRMDIEKLTINIQAGLEIDDNRLLATAYLIEEAIKEWHSGKVSNFKTLEWIGLIGNKDLDTGEHFEQRLMLAILADDPSYLLKTE